MTEAALAPVVPTGPTRDHASYCGASDAPVLVDAHPYKSRLDLWAEKTGRVVWAGNEAAEAGNEFERPILHLYARKLDCELDFSGTLVHPELPHVGATPDAVRDRRRTVQVKFVGYRQAWRWGDEQDGPEGVPPELIPQVHQEAALARLVLGIPADVADVVAQIGTERRVYEIPIDHELGDALITLADDFWSRYVVPDQMPEVVEGDVTLRAIYPSERPMARALLATDRVVELATRYDDLRSVEAEAKREREALGAQLVALIGDGAGFVSPALGIKVSWPNRPGRVGWKQAAAVYRAVAVRCGASEADLDGVEERCRGESTRVLDVRVRKG